MAAIKLGSLPAYFVLHKLLRKTNLQAYFYLFFAYLFVTCLALYEDQVGKFDWRQQYIGAVRYAHFDFASSNRRIIVGTEQNVLAALNPANSQLVWRQLLEPGAIGTIYALGGSSAEIITVTGIEAILRSWDPATGRLNWETPLAVVRDDHNALQKVDATFYSISSKDQVASVMETSFGAFVRLTRYSFRSGKRLSSIRIAAQWLKKGTSCSLVSSSKFVCVDAQSNTIHSLSLEKDKVNAAAATFVSTSIAKLGIAAVDGSTTVVPLIHSHEANRFNVFAIRVGAGDRFELLQANGDVKLVHTFDKVDHVFAAELEDDVLVFTISSSPHVHEFDLKVFRLRTKSYIDDSEIPLIYPEHHGHPEQFFAHCLSKRDGSHSYRFLVQTEANSLLLMQNPGKFVWAREEALASIISVEMVDLPVSESDAQVEEQFDHANANIMVMFGKRLVTQFVQLQAFITNVAIGMHSDVTGGAVDSAVSSSKAKLVRDEFNVHKMSILVTSVGKIYGMDSLTGAIHWQQLVRPLAPHPPADNTNKGGQRLPLYVLRTTAHYPHPPQCAILGIDKTSGHSILYVFDPITGQPVDGNGGIVRLNTRILQVMQLPQYNADFLRGLVLLDQQSKVHVYPKSTFEVAASLADVLYMFTVHVDTGELQGLSLRFSTAKELIAGPVWSLSFPVSYHTITNVVLKRPVEHVHSQGRVMGDRSVLYKYLNPNLAVITAEGYNSIQKSTSISVYLVDIVSGQIIYSAVHRKAKGPIHIVHSENWVVYVLYSEKYRRMEGSVLEMYEGKVQSNTTAFSSLQPPPRPMIEQQSYIFPAAIDSVSVTITDRGITSKHLLFALPMGGIVEIPKALLDPRRSLFPSQELREEGVIPYVPELPLPTENIINYNRSVYRVRGIYTAPTGLESTSLVLAYGLDLFYTRVTPSRTFDILKEDFDHWLIVAVLTALLVASYVSKVLAAKKALKQAWK